MLSYTKIRLPEDDRIAGYSCGGNRALAPLAQINVFVGPNNSGKSRLLRYLFALSAYEFVAKDFDAHEITVWYNDISSKLDDVFHNGQITKIRGLTYQYLAEKLEVEMSRLGGFVNGTERFHNYVMSFINELTGKRDVAELSAAKIADMAKVEYAPGVVNISGNHPKNLAELHDFAKESYSKIHDRICEFDRARYYIPILRGMRPIAEETEGFYRRTYQDYFSSGKYYDPYEGGTFTIAGSGSGELENGVGRRSKHFITTGLELYDTLRRKLLGEPEDRDAVRNYEQFLSVNFFDRKQVTLIPRDGDNTVHVKIGTEKQLALYNLGDGLQNLIIITFNIFMNEEPCLFFIEEPDTHMHPGLQRALLEALSQRKQHQYFMTTHSNHLLDMTMDFSNISVFLFQKIFEENEGQPRFQIISASSRDHNILHELGIRNSSVFLTNATIWVEGITDRLYFRAYMKKYLEELVASDDEATVRRGRTLSRFKEDYHYSFVEYQGSTLDHWTFDPDDESLERIKASFLCGASILIADGDISKRAERKQRFEEMLGESFIILPGKEIENLTPEVFVRAYATKKFEAAGIDVNQIQYGQYGTSDKGLGAYLDSQLGVRKGQGPFGEKSGTIKSKLAFCEAVVALMLDAEWTLTPELREICEKIFHYVEKRNR